MREADLEHHLANPNDKDSAKEAAKPQAKTPSKAGAQPQGKAPAPSEDEADEPPTRELASKKDYQLRQALNHLKGLPLDESHQQ